MNTSMHVYIGPLLEKMLVLFMIYIYVLHGSSATEQLIQYQEQNVVTDL